MSFDRTTFRSISEDLRRSYESAWLRGRAQPVESYLPSKHDHRYLATLEELLQIELEFAWKEAGSTEKSVTQTIASRPIVESYLSRFPSLNEPRVLRRLLKQEYRVRWRFGDRPSPDSVQQRFPQLGITQDDLQLWLLEGDDADEASLCGGDGNDAPPPERFGRYRVTERLGSGAFGIVYRGYDEQLQRDVAIKTAHRRLLAAEAESYLEEARMVAALDHPGIVPVFDVGETDDGLCYVVSKFIAGTDLAQHMRSSPPEARESARIVAQLANALHYAHAQGLVHRDVKPANVLLDQDGQVYLADFGLARRTQQREATTQGTSLAGTPAYMSPEQARGEPADARTDIYSLGVVLYHLLTGRPPCEGATTSELLDRIIEGRIRLPREINKSLPRELQRICLKAMARDPAARYASALAMATDLRDWLRKQSTRRVWRVVAAAILLAVPALAIYFTAIRNSDTIRQPVEPGASSSHLVSSAVQDDRPTRNLALELDQLRQQAQLHREVAPSAAAAIDLRRQLSGFWRRHRARPESMKAALLASQLTWPSDLLDRSQIDSYERRMLELPGAGAGMEDVVAVLGDTRLKGWGPVYGLAFSPDGRLVATAGADQDLNVWDVATGELRNRLEVGLVYAAKFLSPSLIAAQAGRQPLSIWNLNNDEVVTSIATGPIHDMVFSPDQRRVFTCFREPEIKVWNAENGKLLHSWQAHSNVVRQIALSPDGRLLASAGEDHLVKIWNAESGEEIRTLSGHTDAVASVAFSPSGDQLVSAGHDATVRLWNPHSGELQATLSGHAWFIYDVAFDREGKRIGSASIDGTVKLWDAETGELLKTFEGHQEAVHRVAFDPASDRLASSGWCPSVQLWDTSRLKWETPGAGSVALDGGIDLHPGGQLLATAMWNGDIRLWELPSCRIYDVLSHHTGRVHSVWFSADGGSLISAAEDGTVCTWDVNNASLLEVFTALETPTTCVAISPDDQLMAIGAKSGAVSIFDRTGQLVHHLPGHTQKVKALAFGPDSRTLASGSLDQTIRIWDTMRGTCSNVLPQQGSVFSLRFNPDGTSLVAGGGQTWQPGFLRVIDMETGQLASDVPGQAGEIQGLAFRHDGTRLATASLDGQIRVWTWPELQLVETYDLHAPYGMLLRVLYSPEGRHLVALASNGAAYVIRTAQLSAPAPDISPSPDLSPTG